MHCNSAKTGSAAEYGMKSTQITGQQGQGWTPSHKILFINHTTELKMRV